MISTLIRKLNNRKCRLHAQGLLLSLLMLGGCEASQQPVTDSILLAASVGTPTEKKKESHMWITIGERRFSITLVDNPASRAFAAQLPLILDMDELNGNEKKFDLVTALPQNANRPGTIRNGDLMLYGSKTLVLFYLTFESAYSYTRLGRVDDVSGLAQALGRGSIRVVFSKDE